MIGFYKVSLKCLNSQTAIAMPMIDWWSDQEIKFYSALLEQIIQ